MKPLDRFLWDWRLKQFLPYIPPGTRILDIGCAEGLMFQKLGSRLGEGVGLDPTLARPVRAASYRLIPGRFPDDYSETEPFDLITLIAVLEHIPSEELSRTVQKCVGLLKTGGRVIVTVPSPPVDHILRALQWLRLLDGVCVEEHHGLEVEEIPVLFCEAGLQLVKAKKFQCRLNNLFVFQKPV